MMNTPLYGNSVITKPMVMAELAALVKAEGVEAKFSIRQHDFKFTENIILFALSIGNVYQYIEAEAVFVTTSTIEEFSARYLKPAVMNLCDQLKLQAATKPAEPLVAKVTELRPHHNPLIGKLQDDLWEVIGQEKYKDLCSATVVGALEYLKFNIINRS
jgi:hypothetical protein